MKNIFTLVLPLILGLCAGPSVRAQEIISVEQEEVIPPLIVQLLGIPATYSAQNYKVVYTSVDERGRPDTLSGLLSIPVDADLSAPITIYMHGTTTDPDNVPSRAGNLERSLVSGLASNGYIGLAPDYVGLGDDGGDFHPYVHAASEASSGRDLIRAVLTWFEDNPDQTTRPNGQLFVTGYSQGGHASMALHRDIQENPGDDGLEVTAGSHLSGPYSVSEIMTQTVFDPTLNTLPGYLAYTYISYNLVYDLFDDYAEVFDTAYVPLVERFANREIGIGEFDTELSTLLTANEQTLPEIFVDSVREALRTRDTTAAIVQATLDNDTYDWAPEVPTMLYYCTADEQVPFQNALLADSVMAANGSTMVTLIDGGPLGHGACALPAARATLDFFNALADMTSSVERYVERPELRVAPNPVVAGSTLKVLGLPRGEQPYTLYDDMGRVIRQGVLRGGDLRLPAGTPGLHVLRIGLEDGTFAVRRLIVR